MKEKSPAFQWYPKDYLTDTRVILLSLAEEGAYIRMLNICWLQGNTLTGNNKDLLQIIGKECTVEMVKKLKTFFQKNDDGSLWHKRLQVEMDKQNNFRKKASEAGKASASKRWGDKVSVTTVINELQLNSKGSDNSSVTLHSSSSSSSSTPVEISTGLRNFLKEKNAPELMNIEKTVPAPDWPRCFEQWELKVLSDPAWHWTGDEATDMRVLFARLKKWTQTWTYNTAQEKKNGKKNGGHPVRAEEDDYEAQELRRTGGKLKLR